MWTEEFMEQCNTKHDFRAVPPPPASTASGSSARERKRRRTESPLRNCMAEMDRLTNQNIRNLVISCMAELEERAANEDR